MLSKKNKQILITRFKGFAWVYGMIGLAFVLDVSAQAMSMGDMNNVMTVTLGAVLSQVSKYLNTRYDLEQYLILFPKKN